MGNTYSTKKCIQCKLSIGDYGLDYICHITGKGKWNNINICPDCLYNRIDKNKNIKENLSLKVDYNDDFNNNKLG